MDLDTSVVRECVRRALDEDIGSGDVTSRICVPKDRRAVATIRARQSGVLAGLVVATECLRALDEAVVIDARAVDGDAVEPDKVVLTATGNARALLSAERTALNFLQRLSGIATTTAEMVAAAGDRLRVYDTRKTTPGLRVLEKYAVLAGGGHNHRFGLFDQVLIKENHFALAGRPHEEVVRDCVAGSAAPVVAEARDIEEALAVVRGGASIVLLDNFEPGEHLRAVVERVRAAAGGRTVEIEASGGIDRDNIRAYAESGVDRVSIGALTHSARALDLSMLVEAAS